LRGAALLSAGYLIASQALLDLAGWSFIAFGFAALLAVFLGVSHAYGIYRIKPERWMWIPAAFVVYCLLRSFSAVKETGPFGVLASVASAFLGGMGVAIALQAGVRFRFLVYAQLVSCLGQLGIILLGLGPEPAPGEEESFRYAGITGNANELALQLTLGACLIWLLPKRAGLVASCCAFGAVASALALTGSRKAVLIAVFFLILVTIQLFGILPRRRRALFAGALAVPIVLGAAVATPMIARYGEELVSVHRSLEYEDSSYRLRAQMIEKALQLWRQNPLFGNGLDAFRGLSGQGTYAHNNYVELLCDIGLVGVILFYALHIQILVQAMRQHRWLKLSCWVFVLMLLVADVGYVSYKRKQTVMIMMVLAAIVSSTGHRSIVRTGPVAEPQGSLLEDIQRRPRRFVTHV
jgi:O-antigen ligase